LRHASDVRFALKEYAFVNQPVILVVDDDTQVLAAIRRDLRSRYREDYRVLSANSGEAALNAVKQLKARGDALAMMISDQRMPSMLGVDVLAKTRDIYPIARRVLLTAYSDIAAAIRAINEAHLDHYLEKPWDPPEEHLFPAIDDLLSSWQAEYRPEITGIRLIGYQWSPRSHELKEFLAGNLIPYRWFDMERDPDVTRLTEAAGANAQDLPVLILEDGTVLRNPTLANVAESLSLNVAAAHDLYDLIIIGAGPAGLAAAVYGASEGMRTLVLDGRGPGGQAGSSSRIENYLGFPSGVSGNELTRRAVMQAQRLGAEILVPVSATGLAVDGGYKRVALSDGRELVTRAVITATGMTYREHPAAGISDYIDAGVYYGASMTEAHGCRGCRVMVIGGGNSAGQSAVHLSRFAREVSLVVRRDNLTATMSHYLIQQLAALPNVRIRTCMAAERVEGQGRLEKIWLKSLVDDSVSTENVDALFIFIGTRPHADWLPPSVLRNSKGFVLTGRDAEGADAFSRTWKETREPMPLETTIPGIFAAGDVRAGAMNRVASAVGEGAMAVRLVSDYLART
jgi:thioredoxin reductase (NADPH)